MCNLDYDPATIYHAADRKAAKPHQCEECNRTIKPGERYTHTSALYDGHWSTFRTCAGCSEAMAWLSDACGGYMHGDIHRDLADHFNGDEEYIWRLDEIAATGADLRHLVPEFKRATWRPPMSRVWVGRVLVGMRRKWQWPDGRAIVVQPYRRLAEAA